MIKKRTQIVFYCQSPLDLIVFRPIQKYLPPMPIVSDRKQVRTWLREKGIKVKGLPVFPRTVIMCRVGAHKFPCKSVIKIGMTHGAYHFKQMTSAHNFNQFDMFLMTSLRDKQNAEAIGVKNAVAVGYPKLDPAFDGQITNQHINELRNNLKLNTDKPTVLFSATFDASKMSALKLWSGKLALLTPNWNVLVTLHPWVSMSYQKQIQSTPEVHYIRDYYTLPYIMLADVIVGDTSSFLADCCALDKPIITFQLPKADKTIDEIERIIDSISYRIKDFTELRAKLDYALQHKNELSEARAKANRVFFDNLDGRAGERAAQEIKNLLKARGKYELV